jgi:hypothetical protein
MKEGVPVPLIVFLVLASRVRSSSFFFASKLILNMKPISPPCTQHGLLHKRLSCSQCDYSSKSCNSLANHVNRRHGGNRPTAANQDASNPAVIITKLPPDSQKCAETGTGKKVQFKPNFMCAVCGAAFVRKDSLRCHLNQHKTEGEDNKRGYVSIESQKD